MHRQQSVWASSVVSPLASPLASSLASSLVSPLALPLALSPASPLSFALGPFSVPGPGMNPVSLPPQPPRPERSLARTRLRPNAPLPVAGNSRSKRTGPRGEPRRSEHDYGVFERKRQALRRLCLMDVPFVTVRPDKRQEYDTYERKSQAHRRHWQGRFAWGALRRRRKTASRGNCLRSGKIRAWSC